MYRLQSAVSCVGFSDKKFSFARKKSRVVSEFNDFEPRLKSAKNRFQLSAGLNLEKLNAILSGTNQI